MTAETVKGFTASFENALRIRLIDADETPAPETFLSAAELEKAASLKTAKRRRDWLGGRYAAKTLIGAGSPPGTPLTGIRIDYDPFGRPVWLTGDGRPVLISITHSGPFCAAARAENSAVFLGIDLEKIEPRAPAWYTDYFHGGELRGEAGSQPTAGRPEPHSTATRLWTMKEALLKALGLGLKADPLDIDTTGGTPAFSRAAAARYAELGRPPFRTRTLEHGPDYILSMAWQRPDGGGE